MPLPHAMTPEKVEKAEAYLTGRCHVMGSLIKAHGPCSIYNVDADPFEALVDSIIGQQISSKTAGTMRKNLRQLAPAVTPHQLIKVSYEQFRRIGLSGQKTEAIARLSQMIAKGEFNFDSLHDLTDEEVFTRLKGIYGVGQWTAEMFAIFVLRRPNIISEKDAGLRRSANILYGDEIEFQILAKNWHPYSSIASWYLWKHLDAKL